MSSASTGVFVLGMHRSGTSAVARIVNLVGVPLGDPADLMPPSSDNPEGYWESLSLVKWNDEILYRMGGSWAGPPKLPRGWEKDLRLDPIRDHAHAAFAAVYSTPIWAWKDPRNSTTLPFWRDLLGVRSLVVFVWRNPLEVWRSLEKRDGFSKAHAIALWERSMRDALAASAGLPTIFVPYGDLLENPERSGRAIAAFLAAHGIAAEWERAAAEAATFLRPSLRHSTFSAADVVADADLSESQRALALAVDELRGAVDALVPPPLPPETPSTEPLLAERGRGDRFERDAGELRHDLWLTQRIAAETGQRLADAHAEIGRLERSELLLLERLTELASPLFPEDPPAAGTPAGACPPYRPDAQLDNAAYRAWLEEHAERLEGERAELARNLESSTTAPTIGVVVPVYKPDVEALRATVDSVRGQSYARWQLCLCDDGSGDPVLAAALDEWARLEARIRVSRNERNRGISGAMNGALALTDADFVCFLDQDDLLEPDALAEVARAIAADPTIDVVYTDEDKVDEEGERYEPYCKPDWSPELLASQMYLGHLVTIRLSLVEEVGSFRSEFDGSQDFDLALRVTERARKIEHVAKVLYHWRATPGSTAHKYAAKPYADRAARQALRAALERRGEEGEVETGLVDGTFRIRRRIRGTPRVSVIVPFRDGAQLTAHCVRSLREFAGYDEWEALLVDNGSWQPETRALLERLKEDPRCRLLSDSRPFNWSAINNRAATEATGELLLFLNNDIEASSSGWLAALVEHAQRPEVGAVGARLLYPVGCVQHAGVVLGLGGIADHAFRYCPAALPGYFGLAKTTRDVTAVTGACMMVRRAVFDEVGGFDERFHVAFNDIDFCLRLRARGYRVVYTPFAELVHHESVSRGISRDLPETKEMLRRWLPWIRRDPFFNPNLSLRRAEFALRGADEVEPWKKLLESIPES